MRLYDYAASGNCFKVRLVLGMLDVSYERVPVDIFAGDTLTESYGRINPVRETPVLELDGGERLAQSNAILWYLAEGTPFLPDTRYERALVAQWLAFEQERVMGGLGGARFRILTGRELPPGRLETGRDALALLDAHLEDRDWVVGERATIADLSLFAYVSVAPDAGVDVPPRVAVWLDRVRGLPGFADDFVTYPANARPGAGASIYG
jgi:glutathione S-transferase